MVLAFHFVALIVECFVVVSTARSIMNAVLWAKPHREGY